MGRAVAEEEEDIVSLMAAAGVPDELIHVYLDTGKISQSIADKVFKGKVPDKYKDIIVSDEEFKKLMEEANKPAKETAKAEVKEEAKPEMPTEEIPSISEVKEERAQPQEQPKEDKTVKAISKSLDIDEAAAQVMLQRLQSLASKGSNLNEAINTLASLKKVGGEVTSKTTDIATSQIAKKLMEDLTRRYNRMSPQDIIDYVLALKFLSSLEDKGEKGEGGGLNLSELVTLIKLLTPPQQGSNDDIMKMILQMQQQQFQLLMEMMKSSNKPKEEGKDTEKIAELIDKMHAQYQQLIDRLNKEKEERDKMWMETIRTAIEKLAESKETSESIKKQVSELLQSSKIGATSVDEFLKFLDSLTESSKKILESRGYEVKPKEENKSPLENPVITKLVESLLGYINDPSKLQAIRAALGRAPQPTVEVGEEMPHL
jgi:type I site-specific restriction-modification system R (restriction) subunit